MAAPVGMTARTVYCQLRHQLKNKYSNKIGLRTSKEVSTPASCPRMKGRTCLMSAIPGILTVHAFSIPGFGKKKEEAVVVEEVKKDKITSILEEADRLYRDNEVFALYDYLIQFKDENNDEILWRLARAAVDKGKNSTGDDKDKVKKELYYEAFEYVKRALEINQNNFAVHKWFAILLNYTGEYEGTKQSIKNAFLVRDHFLKAIELNPMDATSIHSLGYWCYVIADLKWYEKQFASVFYATPPQSSFEEALTYFQQAEQISPNFYGPNLLMLGKTYMKLRDPKMAYTYLTRCRDYVVTTPDDKKAHEEAVKLIKGMGIKTKPEP